MTSLASNFIRHQAAGEGAVHAGVGSVFGHEFVVAAGFEDLAFAEDEDFVGAGGGGEAMGDEERCSAVHDLFEGLGDDFFTVGVEVGGGFVEDEYFGVGDEGPGDGEALEFAAGESDAAFAELGLKFFRGGFDDGFDVGLF